VSPVGRPQLCAGELSRTSVAMSASSCS
jgi:hypothetical protein